MCASSRNVNIPTPWQAEHPACVQWQDKHSCVASSMCASSRNVNHCSFWGGPVLGVSTGPRFWPQNGSPPTPPQCRPGLLVLEPLWVWPLLSLQVPFYPYRTCFTIQTYQGLVQLRMTTIGPRKQLDWICISASRQPLHISFPCQLWIQKAKKAKKTADVRSTYFSTSGPSVP